MEIVNKLDSSMFKDKIDMPYPNIDLSVMDRDCIPVFVEGIQPGPISLLYDFQGKVYNVGSMSTSAYDLLALLNITPFTLNVSASDCRLVRERKDILEMGVIL